MGWWWSYNLFGHPDRMADNPALFILLSIYFVGAILHFKVIATSFGVNYLFEQKSLKLWFINAGYHSVQFTLYGLIFGLM